MRVCSCLSNKLCCCAVIVMKKPVNDTFTGAPEETFHPVEHFVEIALPRPASWPTKSSSSSHILSGSKAVALHPGGLRPRGSCGWTGFRAAPAPTWQGKHFLIFRDRRSIRSIPFAVSRIKSLRSGYPYLLELDPGRTSYQYLITSSSQCQKGVGLGTNG